jgi:hypothetical protein
MASLVYGIAKKKFAQGLIAWDGAQTFKVMLVTSSYTPNQETHLSRADVTNEVTGTGYTAGGQSLAGNSVTQDTTNHRAVLSCTNPSWSSSTITAAGAVIYQSNGGASSGDPILCYLDFGGNVSSTNNTFVIQVPTGGVMNET